MGPLCWARYLGISLPFRSFTPGIPMRLNYVRKKYTGESAGEYWIAPRSTESRQQGSTRAARPPSVRPQTPWSRTELDRKHNHLDPTEPNGTVRRSEEHTSELQSPCK